MMFTQHIRLATFAYLVIGVALRAENLLRDPGFEESATGAAWKRVGAAEVIADASRARSGGACIKARFEDGVSQQVAVQGGGTYRIAGWIRRFAAGGSEAPKIKVYFLDASGNRADVQAAVFEEVVADRWCPWSALFQAPLHAAAMNLTLRGFFGGSEWFLYDDLVVERVAAVGWPTAETTPLLDGVTVVVADIADVWTDALLRIPPASLVPVDGRFGTSVLLRGEPVRVVLRESFEANWVLVHSMRPTMNLRSGALTVRGGGAGNGWLPLVDLHAEDELVSSVRFEPMGFTEVQLRSPADMQVYLNEIQVLRIEAGTALPGEAVTFAVSPGDAPASLAAEIAEAYAAPQHRQCLVGARDDRPDGTAPLSAECYVNVILAPSADAYGVSGVSANLLLPGAPDGTMVEITVRRPDELDTDIRWTTTTDRGIEPRDSRRGHACVCRLVGKVSGGRLHVRIDVPDLLYAAGEPVWLTLRARDDITLDVARSRVSVHMLSVATATAEYLPQLERLMRRMYSDASEAHVYDSRPWSRMVLGRTVRRVLELDPGNDAAHEIYKRIARVRENVLLVRPGPAEAPDWAVWGREVLRGRDRVIRWWLDHRQQANGELAGHINDDGEFSCNWPSHFLMTGDPRIAEALRKLSDVAWDMSAGTGYTVGSRDVEHAAEDQSCTQPQVLLVDYGSPKAIERYMVMSRYFDLWTAINSVGRRQFRSYMFTTDAVWDEPPFDVDHPYCPLAMVGTGHLLWYTHSPEVEKVFLEEATSWALGCLSTDGGKPAGQIPKEIGAHDSRIDPYAPYPGNPILQKRNVLYRNGAGAYIVRYFLRGADILTGAEPFRRLVELWEPSSENVLERASVLRRLYNEPTVAPVGPERRASVSAAGHTAIEAPFGPVRGNTAIGSPADSTGGSATYAVTVSQPGRYAVWGLLGRVEPSEAGLMPKTFFVTVDDRPRDRIRIHAPADEWTAVTSTTVYDLGAGDHTITVAGRTPGSALKEIGFTSQYSLEGSWEPAQDETALYDAWRATGDMNWLVEELKEAVRQQKRNEWLLTEAEPYTDRIPLPGRTVLSNMYLGDWTSGKSHVPGHWVSWEGGGTDFAALVVDARPDYLKAFLYSFHDRETPMKMRLWRMPHGLYDVVVGIDLDGDGEGDHEVRRERAELRRYDGAVDITAVPGRTLVIELDLVEQFDDIRHRPDLGFDPEDVLVADGSVTVTVHNIGGRAAPGCAVEVHGRNGTVLGRAAVEALAAPHDLEPKTATVRIPLPEGRVPAVVALDPAGEIDEITEANNRVRLDSRNE